MAFVSDCNALTKAHLVASLVCLACLPGADSKELPAEGVEATEGASSTCEALMQGLLIGVLGITAATLKDRGASAFRALRARRCGAPREVAEEPPADAATAVASPQEPSVGVIAAASPQDKGGRVRPAVPPWAKAGDGVDSPAAAAAAGEPDGFGEMLAVARSRGPEAAGAAGSPPARRPALPKPGRGARLLQMRSKVTDFCSLCFDEVDTTEQMGLTCRMLATLKSFADDVIYWEEASKIDEPAFSLLGLDGVAQFALLRIADRAEALVEDRCWREAFKKLCTARPWLTSKSLGGPAEEQRAEAMAEMARAKEQAQQDGEEPSQKEPCDGSACGSSPASDSVAIVMRLPAGSTVHVIGPRAATVTALQTETGAHVWLDKAKDEAHVSGPPHAVEAARRGIRFLLTPTRGGAEADVSPARAPRTPGSPDGSPIGRGLFEHGARGKGSESDLQRAGAEQSSDDETRACTDEEPPDSPSCLASSGSAGGKNTPCVRRWSERTKSIDDKPARSPASAVSLTGIWQECASVAYRVQARGELSWTCHMCGGRGASNKEPIGYDEAAGVYWMGATRAFVAVRVGLEKLDWYPAGDKQRSRPAFSWTRRLAQRRHTA